MLAFDYIIGSRLCRRTVHEQVGLVVPSRTTPLCDLMFLCHATHAIIKEPPLFAILSEGEVMTSSTRRPYMANNCIQSVPSPLKVYVDVRLHEVY